MTRTTNEFNVSDFAPAGTAMYNTSEWMQYVARALPKLTGVWHAHELYFVDHLLMREFHEPLVGSRDELLIVRAVSLCVGIHAQEPGKKELAGSAFFSMSIGDAERPPTLHILGAPAPYPHEDTCDFTALQEQLVADANGVAQRDKAVLVLTRGAPSVGVLRVLMEATTDHVKPRLDAQACIEALSEEARRRTWSISDYARLSMLLFDYHSAGVFQPKDECDLISIVDRYKVRQAQDVHYEYT